MRLTKKAAALLVAATMIASVGVTPVFADGTDAKTKNVNTTSTASTNTTTLTYNVESSYTWTVPADVTFTNSTAAPAEALKGTTSQAKVKVSNNILKAGEKLTITVSGGDNGFVITSGNMSLDYTIKRESANSTENSKAYEELGGTSKNEVMEVNAGTVSAEKELEFTLNTKVKNSSNSAVVAGNYTGTATFTATVSSGN